MPFLTHPTERLQLSWKMKLHAFLRFLNKESLGHIVMASKLYGIIIFCICLSIMEVRFLSTFQYPILGKLLYFRYFFFFLGVTVFGINCPSSRDPAFLFGVTNWIFG